MSRVVDRQHLFHEAEKEHFVALMRKLEAFHGIRVVTYVVMCNHFHLLIEQPDQEAIDCLDAETITSRGQATFPDSRTESRYQGFQSYSTYQASYDTPRNRPTPAKKTCIQQPNNTPADGFRRQSVKKCRLTLKPGEAHYGEPLEQLIENCYNDWTRTSIAWAVWSETSVSHAWLAEHLNMKSAANSSQQIRRFTQVDEKALPAKIRKWKKSRNAG